MISWILLHRGHFCGYNKELSKIKPVEQDVGPRRSLRAATWNNIRIYFDYRYLDGTRSDSQMCTKVNQKVTWDDTYTCNNSDILNQSQITATKTTFDNVKSYLTRLLKVIPMTTSFKVVDFSSYTNYGTYDTISGYDLYMTILSRPRSSSDSTLASAGASSFESTYKRPIQGAVFLNPRAVPTVAQSENSWDNEFFYVCIHEIFHALGITDSRYSSYHPYEVTTPHKNITCSFLKDGKNFTFLITPYAQIYAQKHYGVTKFTGDTGSCPAGIEIEDGGSSGTQGSHLEGRVFMTELMTGTTIQTTGGPFNRLTDASLAILQDTGNYKCTWSMAQPMVWGHPESIDGNYITNFGIGSPQKVFPDGYIVDYGSTAEYTGFDYKFFGYNSEGNTWDCVSNLEYSNVKAYCDGKKFYNPNGYSTIGSNWVYDFMPFKFPSTVCPSGQAMIPSTSSVQKCGEYVCNGYENFTFKLYKTSYDNTYQQLTCTKQNVGQKNSIELSTS